MLDNSRCRPYITKEIPVATGASVHVIGTPLVSVLEGGIEKVKPCEGNASEKVIGFSFGDRLTPLTKGFVASFAIPATAPFTVFVGRKGLLAGQIAIYDDSGSVLLTEGDPANAGEYSVDDDTGIATFNTAQKSHNITVTLRYAPTAEELVMEDNVRITSVDATEFLGQTGVILKGEVFTDQFDASINWSAATAIKTGSGILTDQTGSGAAFACSIIAVPTSGNPYLGIRF